MAANLKIKGVKQQFVADVSICAGLWQTKNRKSFRTNQKRFDIVTTVAKDMQSMGVKFEKVGASCIIHMHIPSNRNMQLLVTTDLIVKEMQQITGLNDTYKKLILHGFKIANGDDVEQFGEKKGILKKITDAIF